MKYGKKISWGGSPPWNQKLFYTQNKSNILLKRYIEPVKLVEVFLLQNILYTDFQTFGFDCQSHPCIRLPLFLCHSMLIMFQVSTIKKTLKAQAQDSDSVEEMREVMQSDKPSKKKLNTKG